MSVPSGKKYLCLADGLKHPLKSAAQLMDRTVYVLAVRQLHVDIVTSAAQLQDY